VRIVHPGESELLKQNVAMQRGLGAKVELIDRLQLKELEPTGKWMKWNWPRMSRIRDMATATLSPTIPDCGAGIGCNLSLEDPCN